MPGPGCDLRRWLERPGSYAEIAAAAEHGALPALAGRLFAHIGDVYGRLEIAAGRDFDAIERLRLTVLVHEAPPCTLEPLLAELDHAGDAADVTAVIAGFGAIWQTRTDDDVARYVAAHRAHLAALLLFEVAHEGRPAANMSRAADLGGMRAAFERWAGRLADAAARAR